MLLDSLYPSFLRTEAKSKMEPTKVKGRKQNQYSSAEFKTDASFTGIPELTAKFFIWWK